MSTSLIRKGAARPFDCTAAFLYGDDPVRVSGVGKKLVEDILSFDFHIAGGGAIGAAVPRICQFILIDHQMHIFGAVK